MDESVSFGLDNMEGSITPPLSPREDFNFDAEDRRPNKRTRLDIDHNIENIKFPVHLDCSKHQRRQSTWSPTQDGYIQSGSLNRLLNGVDQCPGLFNEGTCELFGHMYVTGSALIDNIPHLFSLARQAICKCERLLGQENSWSVVDPTAVEACHLRDQVLMFFLYIQAFLHRYDPSLAMQSADQSSLYVQKLLEFPVLLLQEIKVFCMFIGRLSHRFGPLVHQYATSQHGKDSCLHILLHIHLDLHWNILQVLHLMHTKHIGSQYEDAIVMYLNGHVQSLLQELVTMATIRHNSMTRSDSQGPFVCRCHQEMWLLLIHFLDHRHGNYSASSFWCSLHSVLIPVLEEDVAMETEHITQDGEEDEDTFPKVLPNDKIGVCWWLLRNMASLYQYNRSGQLQGDKGFTVKSHWILAEDLLKAYLPKDGQADEVKLQYYLKCCLALCHLWEPHNKVITMLWDYFKQRLNNNLHVASLGVHNLLSVCKSAQSWFDLCKQRTMDHTASQVHENSFNIFLRILATQLIKMKESGSLQGWKQIQGRFYSKFHSRSMKELNEVGLNRFLSLFITLAMVADLSDVSSRVLDFLDLLPQITLTTGKYKLIWKGLFALCLVHEDHQIDISVVADKLIKEFQPVAREFTQKGIDSTRRSQLWSLVACYIESTQDVFEASNRLNLSEEKLIGQGFHRLLSVCSENEMRIVLNFFQTIMARHRGLYKRVFEQLTRMPSSDASSSSSQQLVKKYTDLAQVLWQCAFPFVRQHATTQTPPSQLADLAASFTLLASDMEGQQMKQQPSTHNALALFKYFGLENKAHYSIRVRYMCHLLPNQSFIDKLQNQFGSDIWPGVLIQAWFSCGVQCAKSNDDQMQELTRLVAKIPQVAAILDSQISDMDVCLETAEPGIVRFIIAVGHYFNDGKSLQERFKRRQEILRYFGDLVPLVQSTLRNHKSNSEIQWLYKVMGHIVKHCAAIIYVKGKAQSQLPQLVGELVLPHALYNSKKSMSSAMLTAIRDSLHLFLEGLGSLGIQRDEFIQRKLHELVTQYFHRFQVKQSPLMSASTAVSINHPMLIALHNSCSRNPSANDSTLRQFILPVIQQKFLAYQGQSPPQNLSNTVNFLQELFQKTLSTEQLVRDTAVLLGTVLDYIFLCNVASAKRQMTSLLTCMMDACRKGATETLEQDLLKVLRGFLLHHIHTHQGAVLHCLESVAVLHPDLMTKLIPECSLIIGQSESKRGVGADSQLRNAYCGLLSHLGESGRIEIRRIKNGDPLL